MAEEHQWLPPRAPGAGEPPRFQSAPETPRAGSLFDDPPPEPPEPPDPPAAQQQPGPQEGPGLTFVQPQPGAGNPMAVASLVLAIAGLALLVLSLGLGFFLSLICSGTAWGLAVAARKRVAAGRASGGDSQARAGLVMGMIGVGLGVVAMIVWIALIASGFDLQQWQEDLQRELDRQNGEFSVLVAALLATVGR